MCNVCNVLNDELGKGPALGLAVDVVDWRHRIVKSPEGEEDD